MYVLLLAPPPPPPLLQYDKARGLGISIHDRLDSLISSHSPKVVTGVPSDDTPIEKLLVAVKAQDVVCICSVYTWECD